MANEEPAIYVNDEWVQSSGGIDTGGFCAVGNSSANGIYDGALRFSNVAIPQGQNIDMAKIIYVYNSVGGGSGSWKFDTYGIDEDNTSSFGSNPIGRSRTTAVTNTNEGQPSGGGTKQIDVTAQVEEIVARGGWSSGNAMGFIFDDNGSSVDVFAFANLSASYLIYRINAEPNFTPSPVSVSAPTLPAVDNIGMRISLPDVDVRTATEQQLLYTSRKHVLKVTSQNITSCVAGVEKLIAHGLSYKPQAKVYVRSNGYSFELPRLYDGATDPVGGGVQGSYSVDNTYLRILLNANADVYYYIFLDEQPT